MLEPRQIVFKGEPRSTNHIYKTACTGNHPRVYMSDDGKAIKEAYIYEAEQQWRYPVLTVPPFGVVIKLFFKTKAKRDIDNYNKIVLDALTGIVWEDDHLVETLLIEKHYDKENPRVEVAVVVMVDDPKPTPVSATELSASKKPKVKKVNPPPRTKVSKLAKK